MPTLSSFFCRLLLPFLGLVCAASLLASAVLVYQFYQDKKLHQAAALVYARQQVERVTALVNQEMQAQMAIAEGVAADLTSGKLPYSGLNDRLQRELQKKSNVFGLGAAFEAYRYDPALPSYAPYYRKDDTGAYTFVQVADYYSYTNRTDPDESGWYFSAFEQGPHWYKSYFDWAAQAMLIEYIVPFYHQDPASGQKEPAGVIYIDNSLDTMTDFIRSIDVGQEGYTAMVSDKGVLVAHPRENLLSKTMDEVAYMLGEPDLKEDAERVRRGEDFYVERISAISGSPAWTFYKPLAVQGWSLVVVVNKDVLAPTAQENIRSLAWIGMSVMIFLISLAAVVFRIDRGMTGNLWTVSALTTLVLFGGIIWMWWVVDSNPIPLENESILINMSNAEAALRFADEQAASYDRNLPVRIPTGVMIQSVKINSSSATISGYIWQKYPLSLPADTVKGVQFPDSISDVIITDAYDFVKENQEVVGWSFVAEFKQDYHLDEYPLDQANVRLRIWPKKLDQNLALIPAFEDYDTMAPTLWPGLAPDLAISEWLIKRSFFTAQDEAYNTDFGSASRIQLDQLPTLVFNLNARRNILSPVVAFCVTILVVAGLMLGSLSVKMESAYSALANSAALFFGVAITHVGLRSSVAAGGVVYLEYFFIVLYVFILLLAIDGILLYSEHPAPLVKYKDNLIARLIFGPLLMVIFFTITMVAFYPPPGPEHPAIMQTIISQTGIESHENNPKSSICPPAYPFGSAAAPVCRPGDQPVSQARRPDWPGAGRQQNPQAGIFAGRGPGGRGAHPDHCRGAAV